VNNAANLSRSPGAEGARRRKFEEDRSGDFIQRGELDPVCFLYPDGPIAVDTVRVISAAMAEAGVPGLGRLLSRCERMVMVDPRGTGWRCSRCPPQPRFGHHSSPPPMVSSMPKW
jgi:hypothetical protein